MQAEWPRLVAERIQASPTQIAEFCRRWKIAEFSLFGSVLREDFRPDSDIDVLVTFLPERRVLWDDQRKMQAEIAALLGREVDLVNHKYLKNPYRRHEILKTRQIIYALQQS